MLDIKFSCNKVKIVRSEPIMAWRCSQISEKKITMVVNLEKKKKKKQPPANFVLYT